MADETGRQDEMTEDESSDSAEAEDEALAATPSSNALVARDNDDDAGDRSSMLAGTRDRLADVLSATDRAAESILDAARAEAEEAIRAARAEADEHVSSTHRRVEELTRERMERLSAVTEDLLDQAEGVRQQVQTLRGALGGATDSLAAELGVPDQAAIESEVVPEVPQLSDPSPRQASSEPLSSQEPPFEEADEAEQGEQFYRADAEPVYEAEASPPEREPRRSLFSRFLRPKPVQQATQPIDSNAIEILIMQMLAGGADRTEIEHRLRTEFQVEDPAALLNAVGPFAAER